MPIFHRCRDVIIWRLHCFTQTGADEKSVPVFCCFPKPCNDDEIQPVIQPCLIAVPRYVATPVTFCQSSALWQNYCTLLRVSKQNFKNKINYGP